MKYLLDTHVVLWTAENSPFLSEKAKAAILDKSTEIYVSIVSAWEIAIKLGTRKLRLDGGLAEYIVDEYFRECEEAIFDAKEE
jgi:PIN domain nuclease of toxin-antitoxin system